ncbi:MAG: hypothetical protein WAK57_07890 [Desulfobacterales bacterium]
MVWLFVTGLIVYGFCNISYGSFTGYRLKQGVRRFLAGSLLLLLLLLLVLSAAALSFFG